MSLKAASAAIGAAVDRLGRMMPEDRAALIRSLKMAWDFVGHDYGPRARPKPSKIRQLLLEDPYTVLEFIPAKGRLLRYQWHLLSPAEKQLLAKEAFPD